MKQRFLCILLCLIITAGCIPSMADTNLSVSAAYNPQTDTIEMNIVGKGIITIIIPPLETDLSQLSDTNLPVYYNSVACESSGYNLKFKIPSEFDGGTYTVFAADESGQTVSDDVIIPSSSISADLIQKLSDTKSPLELSVLIEDNSDSLGIDTTDEFFTQNKKYISEIIISFNKKSDTVKDFYYLYHMAYAIASLKGSNEADAQMIFKTKSIYLDITSDTDYTDYEYVSAGAKEAFNKLLFESDFAKLIKESNEHSFKKVYEELRFVAEVSSSSDRHTLQKIITDTYKSFLNPEDNRQFKSLKYPDAVFSSMMSCELGDLNKIKSSFEACTKKAYNNENPPSSGGSSGGGSGGGGGITLPTAQPIPENKTDNTIDAIFDDVDKSHWASAAVSSLASKGIINGYGNAFMPDNSITRAEFVALICRLFRIVNSDETVEFDDVNKNDWYYEYIVSASKSGIILGDGNGAFRPSDSITRQDACVIINRAISVYGVELQTGNAVSFDDKNSIALYALSDVSILFANGIVKGTSDKTFEPTASISRAQTAQLIYNAANKLKILDLI